MAVFCMVTMDTENNFQFFSFDHDRAWLYGHYDVLHALLYASNNVWELKNLQKWPKMAKKADLSNFDRFHGNKTYFPR